MYAYTPHTLDSSLYEVDGTYGGGNFLFLRIKNSFFEKW